MLPSLIFGSIFDASSSTNSSSEKKDLSGVLMAYDVCFSSESEMLPLFSAAVLVCSYMSYVSFPFLQLSLLICIFYPCLHNTTKMSFRFKL